MKPYAIVTGASGGIGSAIAIQLAREGYDLALVGGRQAERLSQTVSRCYQEGVSVMHLPIDFSDLSSAEPALAELFAPHNPDACGRPLDLLVNCAGISHVGLLQDMTDAEWLRILNVNLTSAFSMCRAAIPPMVRAKKGRILNISSVWGNVGASCETAYSASKGGLHAMTRALAKELAPSGIAVNAIACGLIDTAMNHCFAPEDLASLCEEIPAGRMGTPGEVAATAVLLAQAPTYLTGQVIGLDGGWQPG